MKAAILGVGLIGGSLALCLKERTPCRVSGYDQSQKTLDWAVAAGVIDEGSRDLEEAVKDADFIFLAVPVGMIPELLSRLERQPLSPGCIISDVGSTKGELVRWSEPFRKRGVTYIGGHPMAGSHRSGVEAAHSLLLENAYYILTPSPETPLSEVQKLSGLLQEATKAKLVIMDPYHHDRLVGAISHLPHVIASGLVNQVGRYNEENEWFHRLAAGGFRDLTRIAASHPVMWRDILMSNRYEPAKTDGGLDFRVEDVRDSQSNGKGCKEKIENLFPPGQKSLRKGFPNKERGCASSPIRVLMWMCRPKPGYDRCVAHVARRRGDQSGQHRHHGEPGGCYAGVLRLVFQKEEDLKRAIRLSDAGYRVFSLIDMAIFGLGIGSPRGHFPLWAPDQLRLPVCVCGGGFFQHEPGGPGCTAMISYITLKEGKGADAESRQRESFQQSAPGSGGQVDFPPGGDVRSHRRRNDPDRKFLAR